MGPVSTNPRPPRPTTNPSSTRPALPQPRATHLSGRAASCPATVLIAVHQRGARRRCTRGEGVPSSMEIACPRAISPAHGNGNPLLERVIRSLFVATQAGGRAGHMAQFVITRHTLRRFNSLRAQHREEFGRKAACSAARAGDPRVQRDMVDRPRRIARLENSRRQESVHASSLGRQSDGKPCAQFAIVAPSACASGCKCYLV